MELCAVCAFVSGFFLMFGGVAHVVTRPGGLFILTVKWHWLLFGEYIIVHCMVPVPMSIGLFSVRGCSVCSVFLVHILVWFLWTCRYISAGKVLRSKTGILGMCVISFHNYCQSSKIVYQLPQFWYWDLLFKGCLFSFSKFSVLTSRKNYLGRDGYVKVLTEPESLMKK